MALPGPQNFSNFSDLDSGQDRSDSHQNIRGEKSRETRERKQKEWVTYQSTHKGFSSPMTPIVTEHDDCPRNKSLSCLYAHELFFSGLFFKYILSYVLLFFLSLALADGLFGLLFRGAGTTFACSLCSLFLMYPLSLSSYIYLINIFNNTAK